MGIENHSEQGNSEYKGDGFQRGEEEEIFVQMECAHAHSFLSRSVSFTHLDAWGGGGVGRRERGYR